MADAPQMVGKVEPTFAGINSALFDLAALLEGIKAYGLHHTSAADGDDVARMAAVAKGLATDVGEAVEELEFTLRQGRYSDTSGAAPNRT